MALTWRDAAIEALRGKGPLTAESIVKIISEENLRSITGTTPVAAVGTALYRSIEDEDGRVRLLENGRFEHTGSTDAPSTSKSLSRLEPMNPREIWEDEARNFTPWLFENASYLSEVLGIDVEFETKEHPVGAFSLDLFGRDLTNDCVLVVENQLAETDHKHLGQLLTYAAGTDAETIVWVSPKFRDEHRQALEFLNNKSGELTRFFGIEVSVVRIGDSDPAPMFTLVAKPSEWRAKLAASQNIGEISEKRELYRTFWTRYLETVHQSNPGLTNVRSPSTRNWTNINYLRRGINITLAFVNKQQLACEIYIDVGNSDRNVQILNALKSHQQVIEKAIGESLEWDEIPLKRACRIRAITNGDVSKVSDFPRLVSWLMARQLKMKDVIKPFIDQLPDDFWSQQDDDDHLDT